MGDDSHYPQDTFIMVMISKGLVLRADPPQVVQYLYVQYETVLISLMSQF
jgi:hypothetical protein